MIPDLEVKTVVPLVLLNLCAANESFNAKFRLGLSKFKLNPLCPAPDLGVIFSLLVSRFVPCKQNLHYACLVRWGKYGTQKSHS